MIGYEWVNTDYDDVVKLLDKERNTFIAKLVCTHVAATNDNPNKYRLDFDERTEYIYAKNLDEAKKEARIKLLQYLSDILDEAHRLYEILIKKEDENQ